MFPGHGRLPSDEAEVRRLEREVRRLASMSRQGDCYDNAVAESFFATLEHEPIAEHDWAMRTQAQRAIFEFIEVWCNRIGGS